MAKGRFTGSPGLPGERNPADKLSEKEVHEIRRRLDRGESKKSIAERYGVTRTAIYLIAKGENWGWLKAA